MQFSLLSPAFLGRPYNCHKDVGFLGLERIKKDCDCDFVIIPKQTHSSHFIHIKNLSSPHLERTDNFYTTKDDCDALVITVDDLLLLTDKKKDSISYHGAFGVRTADCLPVLFKVGGLIGIVHAGWRGLAEGIVEKVTSYLCSQSSPTDILYTHCGPSICPEHYEVDEKVISAFGGDEYVAVPQKRDRYLFDLQNTAVKRVRKIADTHNRHVIFEPSSLCTYSDQQFHSFRRDGVNSGRNFSFFRLKCVVP